MASWTSSRRTRARTRRRAVGVVTLTAWLCLPALPAAAQPAPDPDPPAEADPWFGTDKALHLTAGFGLGLGGYTVGVLAFEERWIGVLAGSGLGLLVSGVKEGLDAAGLGTPSAKDFVWGAVGTVLGVGLSVTFDAALRGPVPAESAAQ